jgi:hypothetical protein
VNPALTAMANALRVGDHLIERLGAHVDPALAAASNGQVERAQTQTEHPHTTEPTEVTA